jgi:hypothetical protein
MPRPAETVAMSTAREAPSNHTLTAESRPGGAARPAAPLRRTA